MLLLPSMVLTGELACECSEFRSEPPPLLLLLLLLEADGDRRNEVRRLWREKRAVMAWKREVCIFGSVVWLIGRVLWCVCVLIKIVLAVGLSRPRRND